MENKQEKKSSTFSNGIPPHTFDSTVPFEGERSIRNILDIHSIDKIILCSKNDVENYGNDFSQKIVIERNNREEILAILEKIIEEIGDKNVPFEEKEPTAIILEASLVK